jgi:hypothetical protein
LANSDLANASKRTSARHSSAKPARHGAAWRPSAAGGRVRGRHRPRRRTAQPERVGGCDVSVRSLRRVIQQRRLAAVSRRLAAREASELRRKRSHLCAANGTRWRRTRNRRHGVAAGAALRRRWQFGVEGAGRIWLRSLPALRAYRQFSSVEHSVPPLFYSARCRSDAPLRCALRHACWRAVRQQSHARAGGVMMCAWLRGVAEHDG